MTVYDEKYGTLGFNRQRNRQRNTLDAISNFDAPLDLCPHGIDRDKVCESCHHERATDEP